MHLARDILVPMYREHVRELPCPSCRGSLAGIDGTGWVDDGSLSCIGCAVEYPIVAGVPRLIDSLPHPTGNSRVDPRTRAAFGFEWLRYPVTTYEEDIVTLVGLTGVEPSFYENVTFNNIFSHIPTAADVAASQSAFFQGKRVVEAGCGMGKYVRVVASLNAELVVGLDASDSVERACQLTRTDRNALIVQGDIFHPPLRGGFDFAYSVGVLHHTSDARKAFLSVANLVSGGGEMSVWLYPHAKSWLPALLEFWHERIARPVTSRLPHEPLEVLCLRLGRLTAMKARLNRRGGGSPNSGSSPQRCCCRRTR